MFLKRIPVGKLMTNCYLIADDENHGVIIDPGDQAERLLEIARENKIVIQAIWLTHGHYDHLLAISEIQANTHAELYISAKDEPALQDSTKNLLAFVYPDLLLDIHADKLLHEGDVVYAGTIPFTVWETPGHTPGSICFACEKEMVLFSGDTLFANGGYGRTDLTDGDEATMQASLKRLSMVEQPFHVYPGHGEDFLMGESL
ncbi:MAG: MBL fold metallo-hydrolase [Clostridia bacterium]|nr:MBL fold metallo-hydrolase [Clostridia bacterium]